MEKVFISVEEGIKRLSDGLGKPVDHETLAQAFELAPFGEVPFPLFVRLRHALALGRRGFEVHEDPAPWEDEENTLRQLICPWPSAERPSARSFPNPRFDECFVALDDHRGISNRDGVRIRAHGYFAIVERQAHFIRSGWSLSVCVLPREIYAINENVPPLMIESPFGEPQEWDCLFRAADIDAYLKTARGNVPLAGESSEDGSKGKALTPEQDTPQSKRRLNNVLRVTAALAEMQGMYARGAISGLVAQLELMTADAPKEATVLSILKEARELTKAETPPQKPN